MNRLNFRREHTGKIELARPARRASWLVRWRQWRARRTERKQERRRRAQRLQPKLTRSYLWVTVLAVLAIELCIGLLAATLAFRPALSPAQAAVEANRLAARLMPIAPALQATNAAKVQKALAQPPRQRMTFIVTDADLVVLTAVPQGAARVGVALPAQALEGEPFPHDMAALAKVVSSKRPMLRQSLAGEWARRARDGGSIAVAPIRFAGRLRGWVGVRSAPPADAGQFFQTMLGTIIISSIVVGIFASVVGAGFGWFTARRLTRRLEAIEAASAAWGRGEFGVLAVDEADDEIGQLARRLNAMAEELRELVVLRQNLATAEERNRLSRELHDTVKQQVFATTMQIGAAKVLLERDWDADRDTARARLDTAAELAQGAQSELTAILEQLRPGSYHRPAPSTLATGAANPAPGARDWVAAIERFAREWARQSGIALSFECDCEPPPLPPAESQSLLRLVGEALSNIARHSKATRARVCISSQSSADAHQSTLSLEIVDNGCGFEPDEAPRGLGLQTMRERAESLAGGRFSLQSRRGQGTHLRVCCRIDK